MGLAKTSENPELLEIVATARYACCETFRTRRSNMEKIMHITARAHVWAASICMFVSWPSAQAADSILREQDITEEAIINALTPQGPIDRNETLGIMHRDAYAAQEAASATKGFSAPLLITFKSNSSTLTQGARAALRKVARGLQSAELSRYKFRIEGHADPRGPANANMKLSETRAASVVEYLTREGGIAAGRLTSVGKGSTEPLNLQNPAAPENRRVTIITVID